MILNRQAQIRVDLAALRVFERRLRRTLRLGRRDFNVGLLDDAAIRRLNAAFRGKRAPTDVLSFPWRADGARAAKAGSRELTHFLGDIVISVPTARRNARREGHSTLNELRWLILHGVLHLLGYDHERDGGEMTARELALRARLGLDGAPARRPQRRSAKRR